MMDCAVLSCAICSCALAFVSFIESVCLATLAISSSTDFFEPSDACPTPSSFAV